MYNAAEVEVAEVSSVIAETARSLRIFPEWPSDLADTSPEVLINRLLDEKCGFLERTDIRIELTLRVRAVWDSVGRGGNDSPDQHIFMLCMMKPGKRRQDYIAYFKEVLPKTRW